MVSPIAIIGYNWGNAMLNLVNIKVEKESTVP